MSEDRPDIPPPPAPEETGAQTEHPPAGESEVPATQAPQGDLPTIGGALSTAWQILKREPIFILAPLVVKVLIGTAGALPVIGFVVSLVITGPLLTGLARYALDLVDGKSGNFGDLFLYFQKAFGPTCLAGILLYIFHILGFAVLCVGALFVLATFGFTYLCLADNKAEDAWPAMMFSKNLVARDWMRMISFYLVVALVGVLGVLACLVGWIVTIPLSILAIAAGYRVMIPLQEPLASKLALPESEA